MDSRYGRLLPVMATIVCVGAGLVLLREYGAPVLVVAAMIILIISLLRRRSRPNSVYGRPADDNDPAVRKRG